MKMKKTNSTFTIGTEESCAKMKVTALCFVGGSWMLLPTLSD
jgi:hypothetical protein